VNECQKALAGEWRHVAQGKQVLIDLRHHTHFVTCHSRNPQCRFDHRIWRPTKLPVSLKRQTVADLFDLASDAAGSGESELRLFGGSFVRSLACARCDSRTTRCLSLAGRAAASRRVCVHCGAELASRGFDQVDWLRHGELTAAERRRTLRRLGLASGDVVTCRAQGRERHFQLVDASSHVARSAGEGSPRAAVLQETVLQETVQ
jgi:hypothetical protein